MDKRAAAAAVSIKITRPDVKIIVRSASIFLAPFEELLRRIQPALTLNQLTVLDAIVHSGTVRPFRLAQDMMVSPHLAWETCKQLEALDLISMTERTGQNGVDVSATDNAISYLQLVAEIYEELAECLAEAPQPVDVSPAKVALFALGAAAAGMCQRKRPEDGADNAQRASEPK